MRDTKSITQAVWEELNKDYLEKQAEKKRALVSSAYVHTDYVHLVNYLFVLCIFCFAPHGDSSNQSMFYKTMWNDLLWIGSQELNPEGAQPKRRNRKSAEDIPMGSRWEMKGLESWDVHLHSTFHSNTECQGL